MVAVRELDLGREGVALIASVPTGLPAPELPSLAGSGALAPAACAIARMAFVESSSAARTFRGSQDPIDVDRELLALGGANLDGSVFGAMPAAAGLSQTAVNHRAGARSQAAALVTVLAVVLTLTLLAPLFDDLAEATLGAVVIVAAAGLVDTAALRRLAAVRRGELATACLAGLGVMAWNTVVGVGIGVALSYLLLLRFLGRPPISVQAPDGRWRELDRHVPQRRPGIVVARVGLPVYWASARGVAEHLVAAVDACADEPRVLLLDWSNQPTPGSSLLAAGADLHAQLRRRGVALWIAGGRGPGAAPGTGDVRWFASLDEALAAHGAG